MSVAIYTTPTCPYCEAAKEFFQENDVDYDEKDVVDDEAAREEMVDLSGQLGVPVIAIAKEGQEEPEVVVGFNKPKIAELLGIEG